MNLDSKLRKLLAPLYVPEDFDDAQLVAQIKEIFAEDTALFMLSKNYKTGQEWYDRFERQYHMSADWISADESMGDDAEHDVLNAAKKASKL